MAHQLKYPVIIKAVLDNRIDARFACLISADTHPDTLINEGHLDHIVRCAIKEGLDPIKAIQYVTINVATCFRMDHEMGSITPGKCADTKKRFLPTVTLTAACA